MHISSIQHLFFLKRTIIKRRYPYIRICNATPHNSADSEFNKPMIVSERDDDSSEDQWLIVHSNDEARARTKILKVKISIIWNIKSGKVMYFFCMNWTHSVLKTGLYLVVIYIHMETSIAPFILFTFNCHTEVFIETFSFIWWFYGNSYLELIFGNKIWLLNVCCMVVKFMSMFSEWRQNLVVWYFVHVYNMITEGAA